MKRTIKVVLLAGLLFLGSGIATYTFRAHAISRHDLGLSAGEASEANCKRAKLALYQHGTYNQERGANDYLIYAMRA